ncbi:MAG: hypothetical protein SCJ97_00530 [Bacillota bacterium]|nr:hypothetical protein [Bacillota bacterium]
MHILVLVDIHQSEEKWVQLVGVVIDKRPELVLIAGYLFPKTKGTLAQISYLPYIRKCARSIKQVGTETVLILGNDDNQLLVAEMMQGDGVY